MQQIICNFHNDLYDFQKNYTEIKEKNTIKSIYKKQSKGLF